MPKSRGRPRKNNARISSQRILEAARRLTKRDSKIPTLRGIAQHLEVDPMAIYHYFDSKQTLLEYMASSIVDEVYEPANTSDWEGELATLSISYVDALRAYPGLLQAMLANPVVGPVERFGARFQTAIAQLDVDASTQRDALYLLVDYLHGFAYSANCAGPETAKLRTAELLQPLGLLFTGLRARSVGIAR